jgi:HK97 family phage major capsid protein
MAISDKPWSDFKESDYSLEQWHAACLIHLHDGEPTSKEQCKLPVREPDGTLNRNGVHAAAAALAGARGGVDAPEDEKRKAARALVRLYREMDEEPPESIRQLAGIKSLEVGEEDEIIAFGGACKALDEGRVGGYLVIFTNEKSTDLVGDFFAPDTDFGNHDKTEIYFQHGADPLLGKKSLGTGTLKKDDVGVWVEAILDLRDEYERALYELAKMGKLGWSSGTAPHLVERERVGKAWRIKKWPLGLDASLTPTPAEPRTQVVPLKSLHTAITLSSLLEGQEMPKDEQKAEAKDLSQKSEGETEMTTENVNAQPIQANEQTVTPEKSLPIDYDLLAQKVAEKLDPPARKSVPAVVDANRLGDPEPLKALQAWLRGGAMHESAAKALGAFVTNGELHFTKAPLEEGGTAAALVPNDFYGQIVSKRNELSIMRRLGATVYRTSRDVVDVPVENASMSEFAVTAESAAYDEDEPTFTTKTVNVYKFTKVVKVTEETLNDNATNLDAFLSQKIGEALGLTENHYFLTGTGAGQPEGAVTGATTFNLGSATDISVDEIPSIVWNLKEPYHDGAVWVLRGATIGLLQSKKGSPFQLMPTPAGNAFQMNLWGKPAYISDKMAAVGAGNKSILFGNFKYYLIAESETLTISRNPYLYQANGQIGIFAKVRFGGAVLNPEAFVVGVHP